MMDIQKLESLLEMLSSVGVEQVKISPTEDGSFISGAGSSGNVLVYDELDEKFSEYPMNIQNVNALLSRLRLFDTTKASITLIDNNRGDESLITSMTIKQGRRKITYHLNRKVTTPSRMPDMQFDGEPVTMTQPYVEYLSKAINAVSMTGDKQRRILKMSSKDGEVNVIVSDGEHDSFSDTQEVDEDVITFEAAQWNVPAFQKVMRQCVDKSKENVAQFFVSEQGVAIFLMEPVTVMVPPQAD